MDEIETLTIAAIATVFNDRAELSVCDASGMEMPIFVAQLQAHDVFVDLTEMFGQNVTFHHTPADNCNCRTFWTDFAAVCAANWRNCDGQNIGESNER